jgi:isoquinoline 1-oxidoreductase subunit alpha
MAMQLDVDINGRTLSISASPDTPLLWVLRDELQLTGTKFGCGMGLCGACTVQINGEPAFSCITQVSAVAGKRVTTIEGLSGERAVALRQAWIDEQVPQCGYCQSGQIVSAEALLRRRPSPAGSEIDSAMTGHICRCGTYQRIRKAIVRAAKNVDN